VSEVNLSREEEDSRSFLISLAVRLLMDLWSLPH